MRLHLNRDRSYLLFLIVIAILFSTYYAQNKLVSFSAPPMFSGTDQLDYNNMAFTMMKKNIPGVMVTDEYKKPFLKYKYLHNRYVSIIINSKNKNFRAYAYRPLLYPIALGFIYKIFGYSFSVARLFNISLMIIGSVFLFLIIRNLTNINIALLGGILYLILPNVIKYSNLLLSEIFVVTLLIVFMYFLQKSFTLYQKKDWFLSGLFLGLLVISKQMYYIISMPLLLMLTLYLIKTKKSEIIYYLISPFLLLVLPLFAYNIAITGDTSLKMGTSGWHDMPSAYSKGYIEGKNRFKIREEIFQEYEKEHGIRIKGDIQRSIYGKKIFFENLNKEMIYLLPSLIYFKLKQSLSSNYYTYFILFIISIISLIYLFKIKQLSIYIIAISSILYMNLIIISVTFTDMGRLISSTFPIFIIVAMLFLFKCYTRRKNV